MALRTLIFVLIALPAAPAVVYAQAAPDTRVGVVVLKKGGIDEALRGAIEAAVVRKLVTMGGFAVTPAAEMAERLKTAKATPQELTKAPGVLAAAGRAGLDQLAVVVAQSSPADGGRANYELSFVLADTRFNDVLKNTSAGCPACEADTFSARLPEYADAFFAGPYKLYLFTDPPGAVVSENGAPIGTTPFAAPLPAGPHALSIAKPGYETLEIRFEMAADRPLGAGIPLNKLPDAPVVVAPPPGGPATTPEPEPEPEAAPEPGTGGGIRVVRPRRPVEPEPEVIGPPTMRTKGLRVLLVGVGAALAGVGMTIAAFDTSERADQATRFPEHQRDLRRTADGLAVGSIVMYGVGGALALAGIITALLPEPAPEAEGPAESPPAEGGTSRTRVRMPVLSVAPQPSGLFVSGRIRF